MDSAGADAGHVPDANGVPGAQNVSDFWRRKYEANAQKYWDVFYKRNRANFFRDRNWLLNSAEDDGFGAQLLEGLAGEGVGGSLVADERADHGGAAASHGQLQRRRRRRPGAQHSTHCGNDSDDLDESMGSGSAEASTTTSPLRDCRQGQSRSDSCDRLTVVEAGCGVGNGTLPLLRANDNLFCYAFDFSRVAVDMLRGALAGTAYAARCHVFVHDLTAQHRDDDAARDRNDDTVAARAPGADGSSGDGGDAYVSPPRSLTAHVPAASADYVTLLFVLSSIAPQHHVGALRQMREVLRPRRATTCLSEPAPSSLWPATILFRDYAYGDLAHARFAKSRSSCLAPRYFVRQDGTRAFFFTRRHLRQCARAAGLRLRHVTYVARTIVNRRDNVRMERRWLQAHLVRDDECAGESHEAVGNDEEDMDAEGDDAAHGAVEADVEQGADAVVAAAAARRLAATEQRKAPARGAERRPPNRFLSESSSPKRPGRGA